MSTSRNEPCPCGSGRKYKKCCMKKDIEETKFAQQGPSPHTLCRMFDDPKFRDEHLSGKALERAIDSWTPRKVQALTEEEILAELERIGFPLDRDKFEATTHDVDFGWDLSEKLRPSSLWLSAKDDDFPGLAAVELWKRWFPDRPCIEAIDDWIHDGYETQNEHERLDHWLKAWGEIKKRIPQNVTTVAGVNQVLHSPIELKEWLAELQILLHDMVINKECNPDIGIQVSNDMLRLFPAEREFRISFLCEIGFHQYAAGNIDAGDCAFGKAIEEKANSALPRVNQCYALLDTASDQGDRDLAERVDGLISDAKRCSDASDCCIDDLIDFRKELQP